MNASDDRVDHNDESVSSDTAGNSSMRHVENTTNNNNDCSKLCTLSPGNDSNITCGGAKPKTRELYCNIPYGLPQTSQSPKHCNTIVFQNTSPDLNEPSTSGFGSQSTCTVQNSCFNGSPASNVQLDEDLRNNVDSPAVEKNPVPKVQSCSHEDNESPIQETAAGSLAAVCAASCKRAVAERERRLELGIAGRIRATVDSDSSSDTGNDEGVSGDEESYIYTYKGDQNVDLPSSLFGLSLPSGSDQPGPSAASQNHNRNGSSSPEMDYLEMDFDPDPSGEQDSIDEDSEHGDLLQRPDSQIATPPPELDEAPNDLNASNPHLNNAENCEAPQAQSPTRSNSVHSPQVSNRMFPQSLSQGVEANVASTSSSSTNSTAQPRKANTCWPTRDAWGHHSSGGDLCSPGDNSDVDGDSWADALALRNAGNLRMQGEAFLDSRKFNLHSALYHCIMAKRLVLDKQADFDEEECMGGNLSLGPGGDVQQVLERTMIWTEQEACTKQVSQIASSACGATAVINVLHALNIPFSLDKVKEGVATRLRADTASLATYLFSRSMAGAAHTDLIRGIEVASEGAVYSRFFHTFPERAISLSRWLAVWMKKGAVPIATLNLQSGVAPGHQIPDSWHHQMVFGVSHRGIYLTNPLERVSEAALWPQLCSPSVLLVKRSDIISRWTPNTDDLYRLGSSSDVRWKEMNVLGQVVNVIRESHSQIQLQQGVNRTLTPHVSIPASYCSGILLSVPKDSHVAVELQNAPELPLQDS